MEDAASVLLGFPPAEVLPSDKAYNDAINLHIKRVEHLLTQTKVVTGDNAVTLLQVRLPAVTLYPMDCILTLSSYLQVLNPAVHSLSYLAILDLLQIVNGFSTEQKAAATIDFCTSFDSRQIRYVGPMFTNYLKTMISSTFPLPVRGVSAAVWLCPC